METLNLRACGLGEEDLASFDRGLRERAGPLYFVELYGNPGRSAELLATLRVNRTLGGTASLRVVPSTGLEPRWRQDRPVASTAEADKAAAARSTFCCSGRKAGALLGARAAVPRASFGLRASEQGRRGPIPVVGERRAKRRGYCAGRPHVR